MSHIACGLLEAPAARILHRARLADRLHGITGLQRNCNHACRRSPAAGRQPGAQHCGGQGVVVPPRPPGERRRISRRLRVAALRSRPSCVLRASWSPAECAARRASPCRPPPAPLACRADCAGHCQRAGVPPFSPHRAPGPQEPKHPAVARRHRQDCGRGPGARKTAPFTRAPQPSAPAHARSNCQHLRRYGVPAAPSIWSSHTRLAHSAHGPRFVPTLPHPQAKIIAQEYSAVTGAVGTLAWVSDQTGCMACRCEDAGVHLHRP